MRGRPSWITSAVSAAALKSTVSSAASNADHAAPPTVTPLSFPAYASGTRKRTRNPPEGPAVANDAGTATLARTVYAPPSSPAPCTPTPPLMLNDTRPYRVVSRAADSGASPGASQSRGVALPSHSVRDSGSS